MDVTSWSFSGADWEDPDPGDWRYLGALARGLGERMEAAGLYGGSNGGVTWLDWTHTSAAFDFASYDSDLLSVCPLFFDTDPPTVAQHVAKRIAENCCGTLGGTPVAPESGEQQFLNMTTALGRGATYKRKYLDTSGVERTATGTEWTGSFNPMSAGVEGWITGAMYRLSWSRLLEMAGIDQASLEAFPSRGMEGYTFKSLEMRAWIKARRKMLTPLVWCRLKKPLVDDKGMELEEPPVEAYDFKWRVSMELDTRMLAVGGTAFLRPQGTTEPDQSGIIQQVSNVFGGGCKYWHCSFKWDMGGFVPYSHEWKEGTDFDVELNDASFNSFDDYYGPTRWNWEECGLPFFVEPCPKETRENPWYDGHACGGWQNRESSHTAKVRIMDEGVSVINKIINNWCSGAPGYVVGLDGKISITSGMDGLPIVQKQGGTGPFSSGFGLPGFPSFCYGPNSGTPKLCPDEKPAPLNTLTINGAWGGGASLTHLCAIEGSGASAGWVPAGPGVTKWVENGVHSTRDLRLWGGGPASSIGTFWRGADIKLELSGNGSLSLDIWEETAVETRGYERNTTDNTTKTDVVVTTSGSVVSSLSGVAADTYSKTAPFALKQGNSVTRSGKRSDAGASAAEDKGYSETKGRCLYASAISLKIPVPVEKSGVSYANSSRIERIDETYMFP